MASTSWQTALLLHLTGLPSFGDENRLTTWSDRLHFASEERPACREAASQESGTTVTERSVGRSSGRDLLHQSSASDLSLAVHASVGPCTIPGGERNRKTVCAAAALTTATDVAPPAGLELPSFDFIDAVMKKR